MISGPKRSLTAIDFLANFNVGTPVDARRFRLMMGSIPFPMVVMVVMIVAALVAPVAARQSKYNCAKEKKETQHVFDRVLHSFLFKV